ncbi:MAG: hypothetical protein GYB65_07800 [Chloroflexi bacterium]|nr:hypothetical protein [Chloroflexota bacterium]
MHGYNANIDSAQPLQFSDEELPAWMRQPQRTVDWALIVVVAVCLVVMWPLLSRPSLPRNVGAQLALGHAIEMGESIQAGILYPRWAADLNYGYGSPVWNYQAPLPHYLTGLHYVLMQSKPETSVKSILGVGILLGGLGMFAFVRRRWGTYAGLLAATTYVLSPQMALVEPYLQSDLALLLAMGFFFSSLWAFDRLLENGRGWDIVLSVLLLALLVLAHTPLNVVLALVVLGWLLSRAWLWPQTYSLRGLLAFGLGIGLAAFYWFPAWGERNAARWQRMTTYPVEAEKTLSLARILGPPPLLDLSAINPPETESIGVAVWFLAVLAAVALFTWNWRHVAPDLESMSRGEALQQRLVRMLHTARHEQLEAAFFGGVGVLCLVIVTRVGGTLWAAWPDWPHLYPRDLLPLIAACGAIFAAQIGYLMERWQRPLLASGVMTACWLGIAAAALTVLSVPLWPDRRQSTPDLSGLLRDDKTRGYAIASLMTDWVVPESVIQVPKPSPTLIASYQSSVVEKVSREALPAAIKVGAISHKPQSDRFVVRSSSPATLTLLTFDYPGWRVEVNGDRVPVQHDPESGLIVVPLPEGQNEVYVYFGTTLPRILGWVVAGLALLGTVVFSAALEVVEPEAAEGHGSRRALALHKLNVLVAAGLIVGAGGVVPRVMPGWFTQESAPGVVTVAENQFPRALHGGIDLLAYDMSVEDALHPGDEVTLTLYWRAVRPDLHDYQVHVLLANRVDAGQVAHFAQHRHPGMIPTSQWPVWPLLDYYMRDVYQLTVDPAAPPGQYTIVIEVGECSQLSLYPCEQINPLLVRDGRGTSLGESIVLPTEIEVIAR